MKCTFIEINTLTSTTVTSGAQKQKNDSKLIEKVTIWCGLQAGGMIGSFLLENGKTATVNSGAC